MSALNEKNFDIAGNQFRAYYDAQNKLVFVIDTTHDARTPNVLLVMGPAGDRKWDDVLANDYGVDLETIRPKANNRYQKLDIEYSGLANYDALINAAAMGSDTSAAAAALDAWRGAAAFHAASMRLTTAQAVAARATDTIARTRDTITDLNALLKQLRSKLTKQRSDIGREPTKQSASKILRTEAQIDATNAKLRRAKKRLANAQKRLDDANADIAAAQQILARDDVFESDDREIRLPAAPIPTAITNVYDDDDDMNDDNGADDDTDDDDIVEIEPLFTSDPQIMDENIAFQPIDFSSAPAIESFDADIDDAPSTPAPMMFTPPTSFKPSETISEPEIESVIEPVAAVSGPVETIESNDDTNTIAPINFQPIVNLPSEELSETETIPTEPAVVPVLDTMRPVDEPVMETVVEPEIESAPAPDVSDISRPMPPAPNVAPESEPVVIPAPNVGGATSDNGNARKTTMLYYVMLIVLIVLSIFTLWLYQRKGGNTTPDLTVAAPTTIETSTTTEPETAVVDTESDPFITPEPEPVTAVEPTPEPAPEPVAEPEPEPVIEPSNEPEPLAEIEPIPEQVAVPEIDTEPVAEPAAVEPEPMAEPEPTIESAIDAVAESEPTPESDVVDEIIVDKPAYNVSQNEKMFVAESDVIYDQENDTPMCDDGTPPDINGCCTGETYTDMGDAGFNCCPADGGDCFPPIVF